MIGYTDSDLQHAEVFVNEMQNFSKLLLNQLSLTIPSCWPDLILLLSSSMVDHVYYPELEIVTSSCDAYIFHEDLH